MVLLEIGNRHTAATDVQDSIETAWVPDIQMPVQFSANNLLMAGLYIRGYDIAEIADVLEHSSLYARRLFNDARFVQSVPYKIARAQEFLPKSAVQSMLWMYKHKFLPPISVMQPYTGEYADVFSVGQLDAMGAYLAGHTRQKDIIPQVFLSAGTIRNYFALGRASIRAEITDMTSDQRAVTNNLSAGFWMVQHGFLPHDIIGRDLP